LCSLRISGTLDLAFNSSSNGLPLDSSRHTIESPSDRTRNRPRVKSIECFPIRCPKKVKCETVQSAVVLKKIHEFGGTILPPKRWVPSPIPVLPVARLRLHRRSPGQPRYLQQRLEVRFWHIPPTHRHVPEQGMEVAIPEILLYST
jgi:hypothetical protein